MDDPNMGGAGPLDFAQAALAGNPMPEAEDIKSAEDGNDATAQRQALVKKLIDDVKRWTKHHEKAFERMKRNVRFVGNEDNEQWRDTTGSNPDAYVANITFRFIQQKVASLYARNPRVKAKRRPQVDYAIWDGRQETLQSAITTITMVQQAMQGAQLGMAGLQGAMAPPAPAMGPMMDPQTAMLIVQEAIATRNRRDMIDRIGKTGEVLFHYFIDSARPRFKSQMKQAVRRTCTTGVAWVQLDFERSYNGYRPETETKINDSHDHISKLKASLHTIEKDGESRPDNPLIAEAELQLNHLLSEPDLLIREGLVFDFPTAWSIIPDDECRQLVGLIGCKRLAREYLQTPEAIKARFKVDLTGKFTAYKPASPNDKGPARATADGENAMVKWWEIYDSTTGLMYCVADGYSDFLCEPCGPRVKVDQFFPFYPIVLNEIENDTKLFPPSDVDLIENMQRELNRSREARRQHRIAAQPFHVGGKDKLSEEDRALLKNRGPHEFIGLDALVGGQKVGDVFEAGPVSPIDPNLYDDKPVLQDMLLAGGAQQANLGPTTDSTATEAGIAESSRSQTVSSNVDDVDDLLSDLARDAMGVMLKEVSLETAKKLAGPGAAWPENESNDLAAEIYLDIVAGSSGRKNRERDAAMFERVAPIAVQVPGIQPAWMAKKTVELMDDAVDFDDALLDGIPSTLAMNAMVKGMGAGPAPGGQLQPSTGNPATDPNQQGGFGAMNMPTGMGLSGGPQPGNPAPGDAAAATLSGSLTP